MDPLAIIIGLLFIAVISQNEEIKENQDIKTFFIIFILFLVMGGLGFLLPGRIGASPHTNLILPLQIVFAAVMVSTKGNLKIISQIASLALFLFLITNSFVYT